MGENHWLHGRKPLEVSRWPSPGQVEVPEWHFWFDSSRRQLIQFHADMSVTGCWVCGERFGNPAAVSVNHHQSQRLHTQQAATIQTEQLQRESTHREDCLCMQNVTMIILTLWVTGLGLLSSSSITLEKSLSCQMGWPSWLSRDNWSQKDGHDEKRLPASAAYVCAETGGGLPQGPGRHTQGRKS